jgi:hypothetical protein
MVTKFKWFRGGPRCGLPCLIFFFCCIEVRNFLRRVYIKIQGKTPNPIASCLVDLLVDWLIRWLVCWLVDWCVVCVGGCLAR